MSILRQFRPDHWIYLLVHVVIFFSGVVLAQLGGPIFLAIGTSLAATGISGWAIFLWIRATDRSSEHREQLTKSGIVTIFPARSVPIRPEYERRFNASRSQIDYLGFGLRALREDFYDQFPAWLQHIKIRVLLVDPRAPHQESTYVDQRDAEEKNTIGSIQRDVTTFLNAFQPIKQAFPDRFHVRLYSSIPALHICRIDDDIFWGPYLVGSQSRNTPTLLVDRNGYLFPLLEAHYEQVWGDDRFSCDAYRKVGDTFVSALSGGSGRPFGGTDSSSRGQ